MGRTRSIVAVAVALLALAGLSACDPTPDQDAFYTPPSSLPSGNGTVIRSRSTTFTVDPAFRSQLPGTKAWTMLYTSTTATGGRTAVSGTVIVPSTPWIGLGSRPVVSYAVGTRGLGDPCAPSYTLRHGTDYEGLFISAALARGWAVAITDYQGLGTPGTHTYVVGRAEGYAVLDAARAAQRISGTGLSASSPVGVLGYSQGGGAAAWAAQLQPSYAAELRLKGVAAGGVPADLTEVADGIDGTPFVALALMASIGLDTAYPELHLASYLNDRGRQLLADANSVCLVSFDGVKTLVGTAFHDIDDYVTTNPLQTTPWKARLAENRLGSTKPTAPVFQYHALFDEMVAYPQAAQLRKDWCAKGANVTWATFPVAEHVLGIVQGQVPALDFLSARFAGLPAVSNCFLA
ncbi:MAG: lipase family protein [Acidimicrobiales bacterium]